MLIHRNKKSIIIYKFYCLSVFAILISTYSILYADQDPFERCNGQWVRLGNSFRMLNVYKPDDHGMFPHGVSGNWYSVPGRVFSPDGKYCMSSENPNTVISERWTYSTWVVYKSPDGRSGHWDDCESHVGESVKDPVVNVFDIRVYDKSERLKNYGGCETYYAHWALSGDFSIWEWKCDQSSEPCEDAKQVEREKCGGDDLVDWSYWYDILCTGARCKPDLKKQIGPPVCFQ